MITRKINSDKILEMKNWMRGERKIYDLILDSQDSSILASRSEFKRWKFSGKI